MSNIGEAITIYNYDESVVTETNEIGSCGYVPTSQGIIIGLKRKWFGRYVWVVSLNKGGVIEIPTENVTDNRRY